MSYIKKHDEKWEEGAREFKKLNRNAFMYPMILLIGGLIISFILFPIGILMMIASVMLQGHLGGKVTSNLGYRKGLLDGLTLHIDEMKEMLKKAKEKKKEEEQKPKDQKEK